MCGLSAPVYPNLEKLAVYDKKYALYLKTIQCLDPLWTQMQEVVEGE